ncbi:MULTISPECIES: YlmC/YmxH family sporulation protein [Clostridium]|uniref:YlmC/YmxH family sporulation protein n=1 Tax=Clostridium TaxID=1485 RepID=UPI000289F775|nr:MULTISPECIES: YlmC/YmxH family sporulation protein [Clostridium]MDF2502534.1 sporulation protein YlmC/YmxH family [Clostridium sp.]
MNDNLNDNDNFKLYSEIEKYEIINVNDGEKYAALSNNDVVIDDMGNMKFLILNENKSGLSFFNKSEFSEVPWQYVKKIGTRTIIVDFDDNDLKKV